MRWLFVLAMAAALGCGQRAGSSALGEGAPAAAAPVPPAPFVVFTKSRLVIDQLWHPVPAPVTVGSQPSPETLWSDAPDVVEVSAGGALVARRNGRATVRARGGEGSQLEVEVRAVSAFSVRPAKLTLRPGATGKLEIVAAGSGELIPPEAAQWASDAPQVVVVIGGTVEAGARVGAANILVTYGGQSARALVAVERPRPAPVRKRPASRKGKS